MSTTTEQSPFGALNKIFHEPNRLAILSALCGSTHGMTFSDLKRQCDLTDGNLSRHLKTLGESRVITMRKTFAGNLPKTVVQVTDYGREGFVRYLQALEQVLMQASEALGAESRQTVGSSLWDAFPVLEGNAT